MYFKNNINIIVNPLDLKIVFWGGGGALVGNRRVRHTQADLLPTDERHRALIREEKPSSRNDNTLITKLH